MRSRRTPSVRAAPPRVREGLALAPNEERYVLSEAMASETFGNPWAVRIKGRLDEARLRDAIQRMCDRHEARRTGFEPGPDGHFTRYVETVARPDVRFVSMVGAPATDVRRAIRSWGFERCDLSPHTLNRFLVIRTAADEHLFANYLHHAVNDGETHNAANSEIIDNYAGREPAEPAVQYGDLWDWDWRASPAYLEGEAFWRQFLGDVTDVGELPADGGDPGDGAWGGPARVSLPPDLAAAALRAAKQAGVSEFAFYYAVAQVLFTRLTGVDRVCSTFQSGGRRGVAGSEGVHGVFSNGLAYLSHTTLFNNHTSSTFYASGGGLYTLGDSWAGMEPISLFTSGASANVGGNNAGFKEPRYAELVSLAATEADAVKRKALYVQINDYMLDQAFQMPVAGNIDRILARAGVKNIGHRANSVWALNETYLE